MAQDTRRLRQQLMELTRPQLISICGSNNLSKHGEKVDLINRLVRFELKRNKAHSKGLQLIHSEPLMDSLDILCEYISYFGCIPTTQQLVCYSAYRINAETLSSTQAEEIITIYTKNLHKFRKSKKKTNTPTIQIKQSTCTKTHRKTIKIPINNQHPKHKPKQKRRTSASTPNIALQKSHRGHTRTRKKLKHNYMHRKAILAYDEYQQQQVRMKSHKDKKSKPLKRYEVFESFPDTFDCTENKKSIIKAKGSSLRLQLMINRALELRHDANFISVTIGSNKFETKIVKSERNPQFFETFIFPRYVPKMGKTCVISVACRRHFFFGNDTIVGTAKLELLTERSTPKIELIEIYDSDNKLSGLVSVKQSII